MRTAGLLVFFSLFALIQCRRPAEKSLTVRLEGKETRHSLGQLKYLVPPQNIEIEDYYLKRKIAYRGFPLAALIGVFARDAGAYDEVIFRCADGYLAHVPRSDFETGKLDSFYLAYGEGGDEFKSRIPQGKAEISPEPFYAVATDPQSFSVLSWPYEIIAVEFVNLRKTFPALFFEDIEKEPALKRGFDLFRKECLKCHSLNLQGGDIGPELNVPQNITEYREESYLRAFVANASSFRAKSKMPGFAHLTASDIDRIILYLRKMREHKNAAVKDVKFP